MTDSPNAQFAVWTRYVRSDGKEIRHVYGPFTSRFLANKAKRTMMRTVSDYIRPGEIGEAYVMKMI